LVFHNLLLTPMDAEFRKLERRWVVRWLPGCPLLRCCAGGRVEVSRESWRV